MISDSLIRGTDEMRLDEYLDKNLILPDMRATTKHEALDEMVEAVGRRFTEIDMKKARRVLLEREQLGSTGIGDGVAIPHGKMDNLGRIILVAGRSHQGVEFDALDFKPCHILFMVLAPEQVAGLHLRILAHISRMLKDEAFRRSFMAVADQDGLWSLLKDSQQ